jgi:hypothetical protein
MFRNLRKGRQNALDEQLNYISDQHHTKLDAAKLRHKNEFDALDEKYSSLATRDKELEELKLKRADELRTLAARHRVEVSEAEQKYSNLQNAVEENYKQQTDEYDEQSLALEIRHNNELNLLDTEHRKEIAKIDNEVRRLGIY